MTLFVKAAPANVHLPLRAAIAPQTEVAFQGSHAPHATPYALQMSSKGFHDAPLRASPQAIPATRAAMDAQSLSSERCKRCQAPIQQAFYRQPTNEFSQTPFLNRQPSGFSQSARRKNSHCVNRIATKAPSSLAAAQKAPPIIRSHYAQFLSALDIRATFPHAAR